MAMLAWIIPVEGGGGLTPSHPIVLPPEQPPGIWPSPGHPAHPIAPGGPPPGIWPSPGYPAHPIAPGGPPPGIWPSPGYPSHPIYWPPVGIWPSPGYPAHPIAPGGPEGGGGEAGSGTPEQPINQPPGPNPAWKQVFIPNVGWVWALVPPEGAAPPQVNPLKTDE
jgi:hypothetical protein